MIAAGCGSAEINPPQHSIRWREKCGLVHSKREHSALRPGGYGFTEADLQTEAKQEAA